MLSLSVHLPHTQHYSQSVCRERTRLRRTEKKVRAPFNKYQSVRQHQREMAERITRIAHELHMVKYSLEPNFDQRTRKEVLDSLGIVEFADNISNYNITSNDESESKTSSTILTEMPVHERRCIEERIRREVRGRRRIAFKCLLSQLNFRKRYHLKYQDNSIS